MENDGEKIKEGTLQVMRGLVCVSKKVETCCVLKQETLRQTQNRNEIRVYCSRAIFGRGR